MKIAVVLVLLSAPVILRSAWRHQPGLQADVAVAHLALDLGPRHQRGHRVDDDDVERAGADQHVGDLQGLLAGVRLGDQQRVGVDAELAGVVGVERVLGVDERGDAAGPLRAGHRVQRHRGLAGGLRAVDLHDPAARQPADAEGDVERDRPGRDDLDRHPHLVAEPHDRALAEGLLDLCEGGVERLLAVCCCHAGCLRGSGRCRAPVRCGRAGLALQRRYDPPPTTSESRHRGCGRSDTGKTRSNECSNPTDTPGGPPRSPAARPARPPPR